MTAILSTNGAVLIAGFGTLAIYTFLLKENSLYRCFEHLFIGVATGITIMISIKTTLWPMTLEPLLGLDRVPFPDGTYPEAYDLKRLLWLIPMAIGSLYYFILYPPLSWLAQIVIGLQLGVAGGMALQQTVNFLFPQIKTSIRPLIVFSSDSQGIDYASSIGNIVFLGTLLSVLCYFFFTFPRRSGGLVEKTASTGRLLMMCCFGAFFATTIMGRMALLVERVEFLTNSWWPTLKGLVW